MTAQVFHDSPVHADRDIRPSHSRHALAIQLILFPVNDVVEIEHARIVVVLAREDSIIDILGVHIGNSMLMCVPAAEAHVQPAHESDLPINQAQFLVVSPIQDDIIVHAVQSFQGILRHRCETGRVERQALERSRDIRR